MSDAPRLVLASASPRRAELFAQLGLGVSVRPAHLDESVRDGERPEAYVERLAREKAETVAGVEDDALVIAGDTVVVRDGRLLGKPVSDAEAVAMLLDLQGAVHEVMTGVAVSRAGRTVSDVGRAGVRLRAFGVETARAYVATGEPMDKAGAYGIQGAGAALVEEVTGDYYAVVGFPIVRFVALLERMGWRYAFGRLEPLA